MIIKNIDYSSRFFHEFEKLPSELQKVSVIKIEIFRINPLYPSLRLHMLHGKLKGIWSISISKDYRIVFKRQPDGNILFISIGKHDIYRCI